MSVCIHPLEVNALAPRRNPVRAGSVPVREPTDNSGQQRTPGVRKNRSYTASQAPDLGWKERALWSSSLPTSTTRAWSATRPLPCPSASGPHPSLGPQPLHRQRRETGKGAYDVEMKELGFTPGLSWLKLARWYHPMRSSSVSSSNQESSLIRQRRMYATTSPCSSPPPTSPGRWPRGHRWQGRPARRDLLRLADVGHGPVRFTEDVSARLADSRRSRVPRSRRHSRCSSWSASPSTPMVARSRPASTSWPVIAGSSATHGKPIEADARKKFLYHFKAGPAARQRHDGHRRTGPTLHTP